MLIVPPERVRLSNFKERKFSRELNLTTEMTGSFVVVSVTAEMIGEKETFLMEIEGESKSEMKSRHLIKRLFVVVSVMHSKFSMTISV